MIIQVAIDGPAGAGKSTIAKAVARYFGFTYIDTGAMYRAVVLKATRLGLDLHQESSYKFLSTTSIDFEDNKIILDGEDVSSLIRTNEISSGASLCSTFLTVRQELVRKQQELAGKKSVVMDGRDIGSVVLPHAQIKIYLDADVEVRAQRRYDENQAKNIDKSYEETLEEMKARDYQDMTRKNSPLIRTEDAVLINSSKLNAEEVTEQVIDLIKNRRNIMENEMQKAIEETAEATAAETEQSVETQAVEAASTEEVKAMPEAQEEPAMEGTLAESLANAGQDEKKAAPKYKELQVVDGVVVKVEEAQPERQFGEKKVKAKEERVLIELEDGQQGYLFKRDAYGLPEDAELMDYFFDDDKIQVVIKKVYPDGGKFVFSTVLLKMREDLAQFEKAIEDHEILDATVIKTLPFGILLKYNEFSCLCGYGQADEPKEQWANRVGETIKVCPIRVDYNRIRIIVSQKVAEGILRKQSRKEFKEQLAVGQKYQGTVKNIEQYGAFIEIYPGVEGLLHVSEVAHERIFDLKKVLNIGDQIEVEVIAVDDKHIGLSRKALIPNYWQEYIDANPVGSTVTGKVTEINKFGLVVELAEHVSAFLPRSEYSWDREATYEGKVNVGDEITAKLSEADNVKRRIILSLKQLTANPWETLDIKEGDQFEAVVSEVTDNGCKFIYNGVTGFLPKGGMPLDLIGKVIVGQKLNLMARVIEVEHRRLLGTMRSLKPKFERAPKAEKTERRPRQEKPATVATEDDNSSRMTFTLADLLAQKNK